MLLRPGQNGRGVDILLPGRHIPRPCGATRRHLTSSFENGLPMTTASPGGLAVATRGLTKRFGTRTVVDHLDIAIPAGSVCGFVGPNGAGKTTTIRMLLGLIRPTEGTGTVLGEPLTNPAGYLPRV